MANPKFDKTHLDAVKKDLAAKVKLYQKNIDKGVHNYKNGNYVEFCMYQDLFDDGWEGHTGKPLLTDYIAIGPYSATEVMKNLGIKNSECTAEQRAVYLTVITDAFLSQGYPVTALIPRPKYTNISQKAITLGAPVPEMKYSKWDSFCAFFGIKTEHAKQIDTVIEGHNKLKEAFIKKGKEAVNAAISEKRKAEKAKAAPKAKAVKMSPEKQEEASLKNLKTVLERHSGRIERDTKTFEAANAEIDNNISQFFKPETMQAYKERYGENLKDSYISLEDNVRISAFSYLSARVLAMTGKDMSKEPHGLSEEQLRTIGKEYTTLLTSKSYDTEKRTRAAKEWLTPKAECQFTPAKDLNLADISVPAAQKLGAAAPYMQAKTEVNRLFKGTVEVYAKDLQENAKAHSFFEKARHIAELNRQVKENDLKAANFKMKNMLYNNAMSRIKNEAAVKYRGKISSTNVNSLLANVSAAVDKKTLEVANPADRTAAMADIILRNKESDVFSFNIVTKVDENMKTKYSLQKNKTPFTAPSSFENIIDNEEDYIEEEENQIKENKKAEDIGAVMEEPDDEIEFF